MNAPTTARSQPQKPTFRSIADTPLFAEIVRVISTYLSTSERLVEPVGATTGGATLTVREFHDRFRASGDRPGYLRDHYIGDVFGELERKIYEFLDIDNWFLAPVSHVTPPWFWLFVGGEDTGSEMHLDVMNSAAWNILIEGEKLWEIESPAVAVGRGALPGSLLRQPQVTAQATMVRFVQRAGDLVLVPSGWCHQVRNAGGTVAITGNYVGDDNHTLVAEYLSKRGDSVALEQLRKLELAISRRAAAAK